MDKDQVNVLGVRADGSSEVIGTAPMPPKMKARELVREAFGHWTDEDGSEADMAMFCCEQLITYMGRTQFAITPKQPAEALPLVAEMQRLRAENAELRRYIGHLEPLNAELLEALLMVQTTLDEAERGAKGDDFTHPYPVWTAKVRAAIARATGAGQ